MKEITTEPALYHVVIENVAVFPQCYAAVADKLQTFNKKTLIVDIGSWTIDIMPVVDKVPDESKCVTIPKGLITCMRRKRNSPRAIRNTVRRTKGLLCKEKARVLENSRNGKHIKIGICTYLDAVLWGLH